MGVLVISLLSVVHNCFSPRLGLLIVLSGGWLMTASSSVVDPSAFGSASASLVILSPFSSVSWILPESVCFITLLSFICPRSSVTGIPFAGSIRLMSFVFSVESSPQSSSKAIILPEFDSSTLLFSPVSPQSSSFTGLPLLLSMWATTFFSLVSPHTSRSSCCANLELLLGPLLSHSCRPWSLLLFLLSLPQSSASSLSRRLVFLKLSSLSFSFTHIFFLESHDLVWSQARLQFPVFFWRAFLSSSILDLSSFHWEYSRLSLPDIVSSMLPLLRPGRKPSFSLCTRLMTWLKLAPPHDRSFLPDVLDISTRSLSTRNLEVGLEDSAFFFLSSSSFWIFSLLLASHCLAFRVSFLISLNINPLPLPLPNPVPATSLLTPVEGKLPGFFLAAISLYMSAFLRSSSISFCLLKSSSFFFLIILILASTSSSFFAFSSSPAAWSVSELFSFCLGLDVIVAIDTLMPTRNNYA